MRFLIFLVAIILPVASIEFGIHQSVAVVGKLLCEGSPAADVKVKLYNEDVTFDTLMAATKTDSFGMFNASGTDTEFSDIDPAIFFYHRCNPEVIPPCYRKFRVPVPAWAVTKGKVAKRPFDIGTYHLEMELTQGSIDCMNWILPY